jgi:hypothetical protein
MARKLNSEEVQLFAEALRTDESSTNDAASEQFLLGVSEKRDAALRLTPELAAWFGDDPLGPIVS